MYANHGALKKHQHQIEGINSRLDGLQAAILTAKLPHLPEWTQRRIQNAGLYDKYLVGISELKTPKVRPGSKHSFHLYVIQAENRDELAKWLSTNGVETFIHYPTPLPFLPCYNYLNCSREDFPVVSSLQPKILSLPLYPEMSEEMIAYVSELIKEFYTKTKSRNVTSHFSKSV
jgi:dTDP-4-amino-4,6-dideoxygalactose transaminase